MRINPFSASMTVKVWNLLLMTSAFVSLLLLCCFFIAYTIASDGYIYGQELKNLPYLPIKAQISSEPHYDSNLRLNEAALNFTVLERQSNKTNYNNITTSSNANQDSTISTLTKKEEFRKGFCGINSITSEFSDYVTEYLLPQTCEMPLGIAVDDEDRQVWYVSTKRGILGMYDMTEDKFYQYTIPQWYVRESPSGYSQV